MMVMGVHLHDYDVACTYSLQDAVEEPERVTRSQLGGSGDGHRGS